MWLAAPRRRERLGADARFYLESSSGSSEAPVRGNVRIDLRRFALARRGPCFDARRFFGCRCCWARSMLSMVTIVRLPCRFSVRWSSPDFSKSKTFVRPHPRRLFAFSALTALGSGPPNCSSKVASWALRASMLSVIVWVVLRCCSASWRTSPVSCRMLSARVWWSNAGTSVSSASSARVALEGWLLHLFDGAM